MEQIKKALFVEDKIVAFIVETISGKSVIVTNDSKIRLNGKVKTYTKNEMLVVSDETFNLMIKQWDEKA